MIRVEETFGVWAALHNTFKKVEKKALLKRLGSRLDRLLPLVIDDIKQLNLPKKNTKSSIEDVKKGENLVRKSSKSRRWMMCCFKVCCPPESDEDIARSSEDETEANRTRNNGTEISLNLKITLENEDLNLDKKRVFCAVRRPPDFTVGFDMPMMELKTLLLKEEVHQLLLTAPAGCGKTTLVQMLCQDKQIKGKQVMVLSWRKDECLHVGKEIEWVVLLPSIVLLTSSSLLHTWLETWFCEDGQQKLFKNCENW